MKKSVVVLLHIGFWACYLIIIMLFLGVFAKSIHTDANDIRVENAAQNLFFFALLPSFFTFYVFYLWLFPRYMQKKKFILSIIYGLCVTLGVAVIAYGIHRYMILSGHVKDMDSTGSARGVNTAVEVIAFMTFVTSIVGTVALVIKGFVTWFDELKLKEELKQKNHETEMALIKAQLDPHFLFNTLNNIDVLILKNASEASDYLNKLSDILRFMLYETKTDTILLSKELEYIQKYIELQKIRTSNPNYVNLSIKGNPKQKTIAPTVFIPFIENAFKHTNNKKVDKAITISIDISENDLTFVCENKYSASTTKAPESAGLGNGLIRKRLQLLYPGTHHLEVSKQNDSYRVLLILKK